MSWPAWAHCLRRPLAPPFADISGFTHLTEVLSRNLGPRRGAEELSRLLNQVFGPTTTAIHEHGGSVISFGGDSVISWFAGDDGSQATAAALSLRSFIQVFRYQEAGGPAGDIDIKVAVVHGTSRRVRSAAPSTPTWICWPARSSNPSLQRQRCCSGVRWP